MQLECRVDFGWKSTVRLDAINTYRVAASAECGIESASEKALGPTPHAGASVARVVRDLNDPNPSGAVAAALYHPGGTAGLRAATAGLPCRHSSREIRREPR